MKIKDYAKICKVCSDPIRFGIYVKILKTKNGIAGKKILIDFKITQPTLSFHINKLKLSKLIIEKREGQSHIYYPNMQLFENIKKSIVEGDLSIN